MTYEETPRIKQNKKLIHIMDEKEYKNNMSKKELKDIIAQYKLDIKQSKNDIKRYKLLIKQAKTADKLTKLSR